jgi:putative toxin-antitoxin system antitoxin component (TIGR02293 family)
VPGILKERLESALRAAELDREDIARVVGTNPRTVSRWLREQTSPRKDARERLLEFLAVIERLSTTLRPQPARDWLFTPNPQLDHHKPADLIKDGKYREVLGAVDALAEGVFI